MRGDSERGDEVEVGKILIVIFIYKIRKNLSLAKHCFSEFNKKKYCFSEFSPFIILTSTLVNNHNS